MSAEASRPVFPNPLHNCKWHRRRIPWLTVVVTELHWSLQLLQTTTHILQWLGNDKRLAVEIHKCQQTPIRQPWSVQSNRWIVIKSSKKLGNCSLLHNIELYKVGLRYCSNWNSVFCKLPIFYCVAINCKTSGDTISPGIIPRSFFGVNLSMLHRFLLFYSFQLPAR